MFVLAPPPHKFSNGPSLNQNRYGTYLVHIKFRVLKCHSLDIRIETFHGSLIRQWEVNSIHQLFFSVVCQLLSKHILATFCDNDVARSCNYFLNTNCDTLLFYFFCNNTSFAKTNSMNRARKISTSSFPRSKIFKNRLGDSHRPPYRHQLCLFCRVHNKQSVEGETVLSGSQFR